MDTKQLIGMLFCQIKHYAISSLVIINWLNWLHIFLVTLHINSLCRFCLFIFHVHLVCHFLSLFSRNRRSAFLLNHHILILNSTSSTRHGIWIWSPRVSGQRSVWGGTKKLPRICISTLCVSRNNRHVPFGVSPFYRKPCGAISRRHIPLNCQELQPFHEWCLYAFDRKVHSRMGESACQIRFVVFSFVIFSFLTFWRELGTNFPLIFFSNFQVHVAIVFYRKVFRWQQLDIYLLMLHFLVSLFFSSMSVTSHLKLQRLFSFLFFFLI